MISVIRPNASACDPQTGGFVVVPGSRCRSALERLPHGGGRKLSGSDGTLAREARHPILSRSFARKFSLMAPVILLPRSTKVSIRPFAVQRDRPLLSSDIGVDTCSASRANG